MISNPQHFKQHFNGRPKPHKIEVFRGCNAVSALRDSISLLVGSIGGIRVQHVVKYAESHTLLISDSGAKLWDASNEARHLHFIPRVGGESNKSLFFLMLLLRITREVWCA